MLLLPHACVTADPLQTPEGCVTVMDASNFMLRYSQCHKVQYGWTMSYKDMSSKMNNVLQVICSIFGISCCLPWFHLQIHPGFWVDLQPCTPRTTKCGSGLLLVRQIQIQNGSHSTNPLGLKSDMSISVTQKWVTDTLHDLSQRRRNITWFFPTWTNREQFIWFRRWIKLYFSQ